MFEVDFSLENIEIVKLIDTLFSYARKLLERGFYSFRKYKWPL